MYLQITTKCNMTCEHCCYSCTMRGKHGDYNTILDGIAFARDRDSETISIGGGEPTLHPNFFDILKQCLNDFDYVWFATNGSQTDTMLRLANIIDGEDYPEEECDCIEIHGQEMYDENGCLCYEKIDYGIDCIQQVDKLSVALSQDYYHDEIDEKIINLWTKRANGHNRSHFEIRNVTNSLSGVINEGRAKKTGVATSADDACLCSDILLKPDGKIKLCGCNNSPIMGDVRNGIEDKWEDILCNNDKYNDERCYRSIK